MENSIYICRCGKILKIPQEHLIHKTECILYQNNKESNLTLAEKKLKSNNKMNLAVNNLNLPFQSNANFLGSKILLNEKKSKLDIKSRLCRYDKSEIDINNQNSEGICSKQECIYEYTFKCNLLLECGHDCLGIKSDSCIKFKCLFKNCQMFNNHFNQSNENLCPICMTDNLEIFSLIMLPCLHYVHRKCLLKSLQQKWSGKSINFNFLNCPLCSLSILKKSNITNDSEILSLIYNYKSLYKTIKEQALLLHSVEEVNTEFRLSDYLFYMCEKCEKPFNAGKNYCIFAMDLNNIEEEIKLCLECYDYTKIKGQTNCEIHGRKNIQYKCKFCCNFSSHFCFGTTHFCEECHMRQLKGDYMTSKNSNELVQCSGKDSCVLGISHPPNGEEFGLFCILCK
jgi:hypothetical protein